MLLKRNLLEYLTITTCSGSIICIILNYVINISPLTGVWFLIYLIFLFMLFVIFSFKFIQWLLHLNKPVKYDLEGFVKDYPYLSFLSEVLPKVQRKSLTGEYKEYDMNELSVISTVLEKKLVSSWYVPYISQEIGFPFACKQLLDQIIGKTFQICNKIETKDLYVDVCTVVISHLKEYKKALKRQEKFPDSPIETLYKKSHMVSDANKKCHTAEHCTDIIRVILKELVPWELWDTPYSELLIRILSKKLDSFIDSTLADPVWLNDKLLTIIDDKQPNVASKETTDIVKESEETTELKKDVIQEIPISEESVPVIIKTPVQKIPEQNEEAIQTEKIEDIVEEMPVNTSEPVDIKSSPVLRQRRGRQGRNEVKIYDRVIEGSVKTWETDMDLQCISLGQDLLASLDGQITLSRLWGQDAEPDGSPNPPRRKSPQPLWFGEEDAIDLETDTSPKDPSPVKKEQSPKPGDALLKDLQSSVHQAKTKIGDLQVPYQNLDVPRKYSHDEAAGMMEGLLDFGIAGLKKGLRFTGLSDDSQEKSPSHKVGVERSSPDHKKPSHVEQCEVATVATHKEDNGNSVPPLLKQQRVSSQDSVVSQPKPVKSEYPPIIPLSDSPELEYEEAEDLSTSIAKLRCLLQQRETSPARTDDIWWEGAEETRGRTQHHHSSKPVDTATLADEYDMNAERNTSPGQTTNNMQRLDKLFHRTVTGVFNSILTAVSADGQPSYARPPPTAHWTYVTAPHDRTVGSAIGRLVGSRRAFSHVDAALDSLDHLAPASARKDVIPEDFEEWCSVYGYGWCAICEVAGVLPLSRSHVALRLAALLLADLVESLIDVWLEELTSWLRKQVFLTFERMHHDEEFVHGVLREFDLDYTCAKIMEKVPVLYVFGEETLTEAVRLSVTSFSHKELNKDVIFRALDLFAVHFKKSAGLKNPSFDTN